MLASTGPTIAFRTFFVDTETPRATASVSASDGHLKVARVGDPLRQDEQFGVPEDPCVELRRKPAEQDQPIRFAGNVDSGVAWQAWQRDLNLVGPDFALVGSRSVPEVRLDPQTERTVECRHQRLLPRLALDHGGDAEVMTKHRVEVGLSGYLRRHQGRIYLSTRLASAREDQPEALGTPHRGTRRSRRLNRDVRKTL